MTQAGQYLLLDRIAVGGMAEIYRAKSLGVEGFEKIVALKRILPDLVTDPEFVSMFVQEAKIAGQLSHANIVPIYELGKMGDTHFIAMEYVWGKDARQILRRFARIGQPMPPLMAAWIAAKMLEALDYAHRKRGHDGRHLAIIHRDVSPQNILVSSEGLVRLIDFGIAKAASRATQTQAGIIKGKLAYMSPEQIMGRPIDHRSDIFAATSVLHEMLTGEPVFRGRNDIEIIDRVREARAPLPSEKAPHVSPELDAIVMKGLARDANDRYQSAGDMHEALMRVIASSRPPYGTASLSQWMRVAFAQEMADERAHLQRLSAIAQPGVSVAHGDAASERPSQPGSVYEELSQIVMVEDYERSAAPEVSSPSVRLSIDEDVAPASAPAAHHGASAISASETSSISSITSAVRRPPATSASASAPAPASSVPAPSPIAPPPVEPAPSSGAAPPVGGIADHVQPQREAAPSAGIAPPRVSHEVLTTTAAAPAPRRRGKIGLAVAALAILLALALGGGAVWFFLLGGRTILAS